MIICPPSLSWAETSLDIQTVRQGGGQLDKYSCHACCPGWQWRNRSRGDGGDLHVGLHISHQFWPSLSCPRKLCKIAQGVEDDQKEIQEKEKEKETKLEQKKREKEEEKEVELMRRKRLFGYSEPVYYSKKMSRWTAARSSGDIFLYLFKNIFRLVDKEMRVKKALKALKVRV